MNLYTSVTEWLLALFRKLQRISHWFQRRLTPAGSIVVGAMIAGGIFGIDTRISLAHVVFAVAFSLLMVGFITRGRISPTLEFTRHLPKFVTVGTITHYIVSIKNTATRPISGLTLDERLRQPYPSAADFVKRRNWARIAQESNWFDRVMGYPDWVEWLRNLRAVAIESAALPQLRPGQFTDIELKLHPVHRGIAVFEYFSIARTDPLGLWRTIDDIPAAQSLMVLPRIYPVRWPNFRGKRQDQRGGISQASHVGDSEEFRALRDYRPGDPLRAIHWRSWARTGHPIVKEYQEEYFTRYALVLDTAAVNSNEDNFEATLSLAASFAVVAPGADVLLDLLFVVAESSLARPKDGAVKTITIGRGLGNTETLLTIFAGVKSSAPETFQQLARTVTAHAAIISSALLIFQCWDEARAQLVTVLKEKGIGVRIYAPENTSPHTNNVAPPFPPEGRWLIPSRIREILAGA